MKMDKILSKRVRVTNNAGNKICAEKGKGYR